MDNFFKFPSTPHLYVTGQNIVRDDKVMTTLERETFMKNTVIVEEKIDGANLGISFELDGTLRMQNRGAFLTPPYEGQWKKLSSWMEPRLDLLFDLLEENLILFGEWCYAKHSVYYSRLPDWLLGFDIYDRESGRFYSASRRDGLLKAAGISIVPEIARGQFSLEEVQALLRSSHLSEEPAEGLYIRVDNGDWLAGRAKLVRPCFLQASDMHWSGRDLVANRLLNEEQG